MARPVIETKLSELAFRLAQASPDTELLIVEPDRITSPHEIASCVDAAAYKFGRNVTIDGDFVTTKAGKTLTLIRVTHNISRSRFVHPLILDTARRLFP